MYLHLTKNEILGVAMGVIIRMLAAEPPCYLLSTATLGYCDQISTYLSGYGLMPMCLRLKFSFLYRCTLRSSNQTKENRSSSFDIYTHVRSASTEEEMKIK